MNQGKTLAAAAIAIGLGVTGLVAAAPSATAYVDHDCSDFKSQAAAQHYFNRKGYTAHYDPEELDGYGYVDDGIACESNPAPYYYGTGSGHHHRHHRSGTHHRTFKFASVDHVVDGDTVAVKHRGKVWSVRIIGIDTPEVYGHVERGGKAASAYMKVMLKPGERVHLTIDRSQDRIDRYGRLLRYVSDGDPRQHHGTGDVGKAQLLAGHARVYVYNHNPFKRVAAYRDALAQAKAHHRGLWHRR